MSDTPRTDAVISANEFYEQPSGQHCLVAEGVITFARQLERELNESKLYLSHLEDNMTPEALRFAQAGFDIEKAKIKIAG